MPLTRPVARLVLVAALACSSLAACSDDGEDTAADTTTTAAPTSETEAPSTPASTLPPLDDQAAPAGTNGIRVDDDGVLWIADLDGGQIIGADPTTGAIVARLGADAGVTTPDDLAFDADGALWWTEYPGGAVGRIADPTSPTATSETVASVGSGANPIAIDDDGRVFVGRAIEGVGLYELDPTGDAEPREVNPDPGVINGFDVGPDGRIYAPVSDRGEVVAIDPTTGTIEVVATGIPLPVSVRWSPGGELAVLTGAPAAVTRVDPETGTGGPWATPATPIGDNMAFGADGTLYVTGFDEPTVSAIAPDGTVTTVPVGAP